VDLKRLEICSNETSHNDLISTSPDLVFLGIASHLPLSDLCSLSILNKKLRRRCVTTSSFQLLVRNQVIKTLRLFPTRAEYTTNSKYINPAATGDWLRYGYETTTFPSYRNRKRIITLIKHREEQYFLKASKEGYTSGPNSLIKQKYLETLIDQQLLLRKLNSMYDFKLFLAVIEKLNNAYREDIKGEKFMGKEVIESMKVVEKMVEGKIARMKRLTDEYTEKEIVDRIYERLRLFMEEKKKYAQTRRAVPRYQR
jgi:hypothetical protein